MNADADGGYSKEITRALLVAMLAVIPIAADWIYKEYVQPRPFWVHHYDPEVAYYHSGRELLSGGLPEHVDHPGTPLQILAAVAVRLTGDEPANIEHALRATRWVILITVILGAVALKLTVLRGLSVAISTAAVWVYFINSRALQYNNIVAPEALYFFTGALFLSMLWRTLTQGRSYRRVLATSVLLGLCISVKFLFFAWVPALLIALIVTRNFHTNGEKFLVMLTGTAGITAGFALSTSVVSARYPDMINWLVQLTIHGGPYEIGQAMLPDLSVATENWSTAVSSAKAWYTLLTMCLVACIWRLLQSARQSGSVPQGFPALFAFAVMALLFSHVLIAKRLSLHYLLPTGLIGVLNFALAAHAWRERWSSLQKAVVTTTISVLLVKHIALDVRTHDAVTHDGILAHEAINSAIREHSDGEALIVVFSFRTPQPSFASRFTAAENYQNRLDLMYPREGHYYPWTERLRLPTHAESWDLVVLREQDLNDFPEPLGDVVARVGTYVVLTSPGR